MEETTGSFPCRVWQAATAPHACTRDIGLLLMRVVVGLLMLTQHGWGKLLSYGEKSETWAARSVWVGLSASPWPSSLKSSARHW